MLIGVERASKAGPPHPLNLKKEDFPKAPGLETNRGLVPAAFLGYANRDMSALTFDPNVLAFLTNLLDTDRARTAFRFMWGVGVNEPFPVANLYPVVQAGDPDWRAYYTVNLLNLPNHYHNGGIWPFVGGMWVRFIHRLGFHDVACRELVRLAQVNRLGRDQEWEFNEWVHGSTGKPMGKAFQAWSAACYIRACQEVEIDPTHLKDD